MNKKATIPDAWDDDWEEQADRLADTVEIPQQSIKITKAERLAQHAEINKKLWESAESPDTFHFLAANDNVPMKSDFKPTLKVLSRKPTPKVTQHFDPATGLETMSMEDDEDEEDVRKDQPTPEQLRLKAQQDREEKQRRYDEARARILGAPSGPSLPVGNSTLPTGSEDGRNLRSKGRGRDTGRLENRKADSQSRSKELFDPNSVPGQGFNLQKRNGENPRSSRSTAKEDERIIREPKGPEGNGRGGFSFANKGSKPR